MSYYPEEPPVAYSGNNSSAYEKGFNEKLHQVHDVGTGENISDDVVITEQHNQLSRKLKGRHMQMIAIGK